jgi:hypothetical protein
LIFLYNQFYAQKNKREGDAIVAAWLKGLLTVLLSIVFSVCTIVLVNLLFGGMVVAYWAVIGGGAFGLLYGLQAGIMLIYDLSSFKGWLELIVDMTWSLTNTLFGFIFGNIFYPFFGNLSSSKSKDSGWIVYMPTKTLKVLQTLGTINLGGPGKHERIHLMQARILGPFYLIGYGLNYVVNFTIQVFWTISLGAILYYLKIRQKPYFQPSKDSVVSGFFGWIYRATLFEIWAYATEKT